MLMYKRLLVVVLAACICLLLAACGEDEPDAAAPAEEARPLPSPQIHTNCCTHCNGTPTNAFGGLADPADADR